jgi:hypothetical protein
MEKVLKMLTFISGYKDIINVVTLIIVKTDTFS